MIEFQDFDSQITITFVFKIVLAAVAGLIIGLEREFKGKEAGLKTNTLVAVGAAAYIIMSLEFLGEDYADITRVLSQVVTGIGFLGAGVIMKKEDTIVGLTTAATIWCSAAVGSMAGMGMYIELAIFTLLVLLVNIIFSFVNKTIAKTKDKLK